MICRIWRKISWLYMALELLDTSIKYGAMHHGISILSRHFRLDWHIYMHDTVHQSCYSYHACYMCLMMKWFLFISMHSNFLFILCILTNNYEGNNLSKALARWRPLPASLFDSIIIIFISLSCSPIHHSVAGSEWCELNTAADRCPLHHQLNIAYNELGRWTASTTQSNCPFEH